MLNEGHYIDDTLYHPLNLFLFDFQNNIAVP